MALSRKFCLAKKDFGHVFKKGKTVKNSFFFMRIISEVIKMSSLLRTSFDVIFIAASPIVGKPLKEIKSELTRYINTLFVNPVK